MAYQTISPASGEAMRIFPDIYPIVSSKQLGGINNSDYGRELRNSVSASSSIAIS